jgi:hypothetical protein
MSRQLLLNFLLVLSAGEKFFGDVTNFCSRIIQLNEACDRWAILLLPESVSNFGRQQSSDILVVPAALNNNGAVGVRRAWILGQVRSEKSVLSLEGRGYLFGVDALDLKRDDCVSYSKGAVVVGPGESEQESWDSDE